MGDKGQMPIEEVFSECGSTPKDAISGAKYVPPAAEVVGFALEKGFAISNEVKTQGAPGGNQKYGKETWGTNTYNSSTGTWSGNGWGDETDW